jgi:hypothetical protein
MNNETMTYEQTCAYGESLPQIINYRSLSNKIVVGLLRGDGYCDFAAYIYTVPGKNHQQEIKEAVLEGNGAKLDYKVADALFGGTIERLENNGMYWRM